MLIRTFEFKLKPTAEQVKLFESWMVACRKVYNYALAERKAWANSRKCEINASRGMLRKHTLDAGFGQFLSILEFVCQKRGVYFERVDPNLTSQICPRCQTLTGKKLLSERVHSCPQCGYTTNRDVAAAQVVMQRGLNSVGGNAGVSPAYSTPT